ncbi:MAG: hypothetical protein IPO21_03380 [Bacteroidales bacterium]|nr:hypothetical protein [Bacteroidales bacterium]
MENNCPSAEKCPIFNGILSDKLTTSKSYRKQFCEAGEASWQTCKRLMTKTQYGKCPPELLPNSAMTVDEIGIKFNLK